MSVAIAIDVTGDAAVQAKLRRLSNVRIDELLEVVGSEAENQTRRRIQSEKTAPDGTPWKPWSERYKRSRRRGKSLLSSTGDLLDSISSLVTAESVLVGANLKYAAVHQHGGGALDPTNPAHGIPARPYLGLSDENEADIRQVIEDYLTELAA